MAGVFALDLALVTGWCLAEPGCRPVFGAWHLPRIGGEGARYCALENEISEALQVHQPDKLVIEAPLPLPAYMHPEGGDWQTNSDAIRQQLGLRACAYSEAYRAEVQVFEVDAYTARREMMGTGRFPRGTVKAHVMAWCRKQGWNVHEDNSADAVVLAAYTARQLGWRLSTGPKVTA